MSKTDVPNLLVDNLRISVSIIYFQVYFTLSEFQRITQKNSTEIQKTTNPPGFDAPGCPACPRPVVHLNKARGGRAPLRLPSHLSARTPPKKNRDHTEKKNSTVVNIDCQTWIEYVGIVYR